MPKQRPDRDQRPLPTMDDAAIDWGEQAAAEDIATLMSAYRRLVTADRGLAKAIDDFANEWGPWVVPELNDKAAELLRVGPAELKRIERSLKDIVRERSEIEEVTTPF